jgi:large subunit ribosomal protein L29
VKAAELRGLDETQLEAELTDLHEEWRKHRFDEAVGKLTATHRIREIRKTIARIHTIRTERQIDAAIQAGTPLRPKRRRK